MKFVEKDIAQIALFAALVAALGLVPSLMLPSGIPVSAQSLGVMLAGIVLGATRGGMALLLFILLVALGLPLLSGGRGGLGVFAGPTMGFVIGFPMAAWATGLIMERVPGPVYAIAGLAAFVGGIIVLYAFGILGFYLLTDNSLAAATGIMAVYIPGDLIKVVLAAVLAHALWRARPGLFRSKA